MKLYNATMHYVEILVAEASFHGTEALTYTSETLLNIGQLVFVPLRNKEVIGVVTAITNKKPPFSVKPVMSVPAIPPIPKHLIDIAQWMRVYYPAPLGTIVQQILPKGLPKKEVPDLEETSSKQSLHSRQPVCISCTETPAQARPASTWSLRFAP
jgi:primosomal protein N'